MEHAHDADRAALARRIMRRQATLGLRVAAVFVLILVGLPLVNLYLPSVAAIRVGGFSFSWLFLAVLFYPITWVLSWWFVKGSDEIEAAIVRDERVALTAAKPVTPPAPTTEKRKLFVEEDEA